MTRSLRKPQWAPDTRRDIRNSPERRAPLRCWLGLTLLGACVGTEAPYDGGSNLVVGDPCITLDESSPDFAGYSDREVNLEDGGSCGAVNVCLVSGFRGRATCPDGQADGESGGCTTPSGVPVQVPVESQLPDRPSEIAMVCSCRCDGPDPGATYCTCPESMRCEELVRGGADGARTEYAGSYCVY